MHARACVCMLRMSEFPRYIFMRILQKLMRVVKSINFANVAKNKQLLSSGYRGALF